MRCPRCNSVTAVSHSNRQGDAQYRKRYCTALDCRHAFGTYETLESPAAIERRLRNEIRAGLIPPKATPRTPEERAEARRAYKRAWVKANAPKMREAMKRWTAKNPERAAAMRKKSNLRRAARDEARTTGEPVETIYARWGVV